MSLRQLRQSGSPFGPDRVTGVRPGVEYVTHGQVTTGTDTATVTLADLQEGDLLVAQFTNAYARVLTSLTSDGMTFTAGFDPGNLAGQQRVYYGLVPAGGDRDVTVLYATSGVVGLQVLALRSTAPAFDVAIPGTATDLAAALTMTIPSFDTVTDGAGAVAALILLDDNRPTFTTAGWVGSTLDDIANLSMVLAFKPMPTAGATGALDVIENVGGPDAGRYLRFAFSRIPA